MAFPKTVAHRFLAMAKIRPPQAPSGHPPSLLRRLLPDSVREQGLLRRLLQRRPFVHSAVPPERLCLPTGDKLIERLRQLNGDRITVGALLPPPAPAESVAEGAVGGMSVEEVRKVLKAWQMEAVRSRLRATRRSCVSYSEFSQICCDASSPEQGPGLAKALDESGAVIALGSIVFLRPDQELIEVAKAIEGVIPASMAPRGDPRSDELREMEEKKSAIDKKAEAQVRRELWCGLGFLLAQTAGFFRLTFWELSWDVMEPICFYVTSVYFMAGYAFFLRTAKDPSFEGFFESRLAAKQRRLMRAHDFDLRRFNELRGVRPIPQRDSEELARAPYCHCNQRGALLGAAQ